MAGLNKCVMLLLILFGISSVAQASFETKLSDTHVQSVLQNYFPVREYAALARVTLQEPTVRLEKNNKDIILTIPVDVSIINEAVHHGHMTVLAGLSYQASSGGLYLSNPRIHQLVIPNLDKKMLVELREFIETIIKNALPLVRIYKVKEQDLNHSLAKSALKSFQIEDHHLKLEFGFK